MACLSEQYRLFALRSEQTETVLPKQTSEMHLADVHSIEKDMAKHDFV